MREKELKYKETEFKLHFTGTIEWAFPKNIFLREISNVAFCILKEFLAGESAPYRETE